MVDFVVHFFSQYRKFETYNFQNTNICTEIERSILIRILDLGEIPCGSFIYTDSRWLDNTNCRVLFQTIIHQGFKKCLIHSHNCITIMAI